MLSMVGLESERGGWNTLTTELFRSNRKVTF